MHQCDVIEEVQPESTNRGEDRLSSVTLGDDDRNLEEVGDLEQAFGSRKDETMTMNDLHQSALHVDHDNYTSIAFEYRHS